MSTPELRARVEARQAASLAKHLARSKPRGAASSPATPAANQVNPCGRQAAGELFAISPPSLTVVRRGAQYLHDRGRSACSSPDTLPGDAPPPFPQPVQASVTAMTEQDDMAEPAGGFATQGPTNASSARVSEPAETAAAAPAAASSPATAAVYPSSSTPGMRTHVLRANLRHAHAPSLGASPSCAEPG